ncbi:hypothetical protein [Flavobacterium sp. AG291]|uniref:hypothetical protein n=1 Tax=Flavobacterium sp. AG291 TaxID=2184000 RepID=UPI000E0BF6A4|nr:hypothetical protein [Flavobacterium sp. AG291]RDI07072.1 hypothetical protein DEU42_113172 [Flavobacterium sp. AG291]
MQEYKIYAAKHSDIRTGKVWNTEGLGSNLIKIKIKHKSIIVSNRRIDDNFERIFFGEFTEKINGKPKEESKKKFDENSLVIDEYYRLRLNIDTSKTYRAEIKPVRKFDIYSQLRYLWQHPDDVVRITFWLAVASIIISIFGTDIRNFLECLWNLAHCIFSVKCTCN